MKRDREREGDRLTETIIQLRSMLARAQADMDTAAEILNLPPREHNDLHLREARKHLRSANTRIVLVHRAIGGRMSSAHLMAQHTFNQEEVNQ